MQYNSHASNQDCVSEILKICGATTNDYSLNDIARRFNSAMDDYFSIAFESDGRWNFDDLTATTPPLEGYTITSGTNRYKLADFTADIINVLKIEILNSAGTGLFLIPEIFTDTGIVTETNTSGQLNNISADTFQELYVNAPSGVPTHYIKYGDYIYLRPNPNYTEADGLLVYFNRPAVYVVTGDTTKVPGVPTTHHNALCRMAALPYLIERNLPQARAVAQQIQADMSNIASHYARRGKDTRHSLIPNVENNK